MEPKAGKGKWKPQAIIFSLTSMSKILRRLWRAISGFMSKSTAQSGLRANRDGTLVMSAPQIKDCLMDLMENKVWRGLSPKESKDAIPGTTMLSSSNLTNWCSGEPFRDRSHQPTLHVRSCRSIAGPVGPECIFRPRHVPSDHAIGVKWMPWQIAAQLVFAPPMAEK